MRHIFSVFLSLIGAVAVSAQGLECLIPVPTDILLSDGTYTYDQEPQVIVKFQEEFAPEAYELHITPEGIHIKTSTESGAFYARQTLAQITGYGSEKMIPCCIVKDAPRFSYRGLHVDVSRHFRSLDFLKKQIDAMAMFKMNRMHLHLTDAAGWRMQIEAYPRLTSLAAWRPQHTWKEWWAGNRHYAEEGQEGAYGGYYTKDELRDLVSVEPQNWHVCPSLSRIRSRFSFHSGLSNNS